MFHHEVGGAVFEVAAVDQAGDRGMVERREDVPFAVQSAAQPRVYRRLLQNLDRHGLMVLRIVALAAIYGAHPSMAEDGYDAIRSDARADQPVAVILEQ